MTRKSGKAAAPVGWGELNIESVGRLYRGKWVKKYYSSSRGKNRHPYPLGYTAVRVFGGHVFNLAILEGPRGPLFQVTCAEGIVTCEETPSAAWAASLSKKHQNLLRGGSKQGAQSLSGEEAFGFTQAAVLQYLKELEESPFLREDKHVEPTGLPEPEGAKGSACTSDSAESLSQQWAEQKRHKEKGGAESCHKPEPSGAATHLQDFSAERGKPQIGKQEQQVAQYGGEGESSGVAQTERQPYVLFNLFKGVSERLEETSHQDPGKGADCCPLLASSEFTRQADAPPFCPSAWPALAMTLSPSISDFNLPAMFFPPTASLSVSALVADHVTSTDEPNFRLEVPGAVTPPLLPVADTACIAEGREESTVDARCTPAIAELAAKSLFDLESTPDRDLKQPLLRSKEGGTGSKEGGTHPCGPVVAVEQPVGRAIDEPVGRKDAVDCPSAEGDLREAPTALERSTKNASNNPDIGPVSCVDGKHPSVAVEDLARRGGSSAAAPPQERGGGGDGWIAKRRRTSLAGKAQAKIYRALLGGGQEEHLQGGPPLPVRIQLEDEGATGKIERTGSPGRSQMQVTQHSKPLGDAMDMEPLPLAATAAEGPSACRPEGAAEVSCQVAGAEGSDANEEVPGPTGHYAATAGANRGVHDLGLAGDDSYGGRSRATAPWAVAGPVHNAEKVVSGVTSSIQAARGFEVQGRGMGSAQEGEAAESAAKVEHAPDSTLSMGIAPQLEMQATHELAEASAEQAAPTRLAQAGRSAEVLRESEPGAVQGTALQGAGTGTAASEAAETNKGTLRCSGPSAAKLVVNRTPKPSRSSKKADGASKGAQPKGTSVMEQLAALSSSRQSAPRALCSVPMKPGFSPIPLVLANVSQGPTFSGRKALEELAVNPGPARIYPLGVQPGRVLKGSPSDAAQRQPAAAEGELAGATVSTVKRVDLPTERSEVEHAGAMATLDDTCRSRRAPMELEQAEAAPTEQEDKGARCTDAEATTVWVDLPPLSGPDTAQPGTAPALGAGPEAPSCLEAPAAASCGPPGGTRGAATQGPRQAWQQTQRPPAARPVMCIQHPAAVRSVVFGGAGAFACMGVLYGDPEGVALSLVMYALDSSLRTGRSGARFGCRVALKLDLHLRAAEDHNTAEKVALYQNGLCLGPKGDPCILIGAFAVAGDAAATPPGGHPRHAKSKKAPLELAGKQGTSREDNPLSSLQLLAVSGGSEVASLPCVAPMRCVAVLGDSVLAAAGDGGAVECWQMDATWRAHTSTWPLPRGQYRGVPFHQITTLAGVPGQPDLLVGSAQNASFAIWNHTTRTLLSSSHSLNHTISAVHVLDLGAAPAAAARGEKPAEARADRSWAGPQAERCVSERPGVARSGDGGATLGAAGRAPPSEATTPVGPAPAAAGWAPVMLLALAAERQGRRPEAVQAAGGRSCHVAEGGAASGGEHSPLPAQEAVPAEAGCRPVCLRESRLVIGAALGPSRVTAMATQGRQGLLGGRDGLVCVTDVVTGEVQAELKELRGWPISCICASPASGAIATGSSDGRVMLYMH